ncbi:MAG: cobalamin-binding protein [Firmicutes bacterium]|jgi:5-methyltetrahydrofolate--homocysteine methyltransferase|nr:cobalamin-binding protein [Bacillota bacterium]
MAVLQEMADALIAGNANKVKELTEKALAEGIPAGQIIRDGLIPGMAVIGERFKKNEIYVPEVLIAARAMQAGLGIVKPLLSEAEAAEKLGTVCIGTVKGDLHDIGKNLVAMMLEGAGFEVIDLGVDVPPEKFVEAVKEHNANYVALSALLTTTMVNMKETIQALTDAGLRDSVKVLVGGAPVTQSFADDIGADGYAPDSGTAVDIAKKLIGAA